MTGKQIAANLRGSRRKWTSGQLFDGGDGAFCVLGIKAAEAGVKPEFMEALSAGIYENPRGDEVEIPYGRFQGVKSLYHLNDDASSKRELIKTLETEYGDNHFEVEGFVAKLLQLQEKYYKK